ncbi:MAG: aspartate dehydrogenase [Pseudomonadota bacterium]
MLVGIAGMGAIGMALAERLDAGEEGLTLAAVASRDAAKVARQVSGFCNPPEVVDVASLAQHADVIVEAAPAAVFDDIAGPAVAAGRIFVPSSVAQLLNRDELIAQARRTGARIVVPTGALLGLDAVRAAAEGGIHAVRMVTRKPPGGLAGAPHLVNNNIDVSDLREALLVFKGSARDGAIGFPANVNVAAALSLAGVGPDATELEVWADPGVSRNTHTIHVDAAAVRFEMTIENVPSPENPRTGLLTPLSVLATLQGLVSTLKVGT